MHAFMMQPEHAVVQGSANAAFAGAVVDVCICSYRLQGTTVLQTSGAVANAARMQSGHYTHWEGSHVGGDGG